MAVESFMMEMSADAEIRRFAYTRKDLISDSGMCFYRCEFLLGKPAFLVDYGIGDTYLSHVMQQCRIIDLSAFGRGLFDKFRYFP